MCLAVPGRIVAIDGDMAVVEYDGEQQTVSLSLIEAAVGDYVIANAGFAIEKIDADEAEKSIAIFKGLVAGK
jgi:hydrogenase expression/formation protein HypC